MPENKVIIVFLDFLILIINYFLKIKNVNFSNKSTLTMLKTLKYFRNVYLIMFVCDYIL